MKPTIIMIDDDSFYLEEYKRILYGEFVVLTATNVHDGFELISRKHPDLLLLDITLDKEYEGMDIIPLSKKKFPWMPIIMVTNHDSHTLFKNAKKLGAVDYFVKSSNLDELKILINNYLKTTNKLEERNGIIVKSKLMRNVFERALKVAKFNNTVLLIGESGTGKEILSKFIHNNSKYKNGPFFALNCGAISENLLESELFGHEKGAFTGAHKVKKGVIEQAHGGTLFLDEIEDLPLQAQVALLRVLENKVVYPVGGNKPIHVDFRLIAASKTDLKLKIKQNSFREDLYYRIKGYVIQIPPLRKRRDDIIPLANYFMKNFCSKHNIPGKTFTQGALLILQNYSWPGNVRELKNVIETSIPNSYNNQISSNDLQIELDDKNKTNLNFKLAKEQLIQKFEEDTLREALTRNNGNITKSALYMGVSRRYVHGLITKYRINVKENK